MIEGNDGGATVSSDGGAELDDHRQPGDRAVLPRDRGRPVPVPRLRRARDNSTVGIASRTTGVGIGESDWYDVGGWARAAT